MLGTLRWLVDKLWSLNKEKKDKAEKTASESYRTIKELFGKIHEEYKNNFLEYLNYFANNGDANSILNRISALNKLTADDRAELLRLVKNSGEKGNQPYNLLLEYFGAPDSDNMYSVFDEENIVYQRWRSGIKGDIQSIMAEDWQTFFDPGAGRPPMTEAELEEEKAQRWQSLKRTTEHTMEIEKLKQYLIEDSINKNLETCQKLAIQINSALDQLKPD